MRYVVYAAIVIAAALVGAAAFDQPGDPPASQQLPTTITNATPSIDEAATAVTAALAGPPPARTADSTRSGADRYIDSGSDVTSPPGTATATTATTATVTTVSGELVDDDVAAAALSPDDVAAQFALAALNDRYDTPLKDRRLALAAWASPDVVAAWTEHMTNDQRAAATVTSAGATTVSVTQLDATTWTAAVTAAVTESNADGPTTVTELHLELRLETHADGLQVTAAELTGGP